MQPWSEENLYPEITRIVTEAPSVRRGQELGRLVAAFADPPLAFDSPRRLAAHAAEQLTSLLHHHRGRSARLN